MNILDYSIRLGKLLRKTDEGRRLYQMKNNIEEKYHDKENYRQYEQFAEKKTSQFYFYSWDMAYRAFLNVLRDDTIEHRNLFMPTAELVASDEEISLFATTSADFGKIFEKLVANVISGGEFEKDIPSGWKFKVKNAISDVQIAVERTLLAKTIALYYQKNQGQINSVETQKYLSMREERKFLPFSKKALEAMSEAQAVSMKEKILYEKMYLIIEAVKKGIFYGFWGMINEINQEELLNNEELHESTLREVDFSHDNNYSSFFGTGWLYKIQLGKESIFFMAHKKKVHMDSCNQVTTVSGVIYPIDDKRLFEDETEILLT